MLSDVGRVAVAACVVASVAVAARDARPCVLLLPSHALPAPGPAPVNAHVWLHHPPVQRVDNPTRVPYDADFVLRRVAPDTADVAIATREWCPLVLVELVPLAPLAPNARFEVWAAPRGGAAAPNAPPARLLASFATGASEDRTPPERPKLLEGLHDTDEGAIASCGVGDTITLRGDPGREMLGVWASDARGAVAWSSPPVAILFGRELSRFESCKADFGAWARSKPHLGARAIDVAGNLSEPVEIDVVSAR